MRTFKYLQSVQYTCTSAVQVVNKEMSKTLDRAFSGAWVSTSLMATSIMVAEYVAYGQKSVILGVIGVIAMAIAFACWSD